MRFSPCCHYVQSNWCLLLFKLCAPFVFMARHILQLPREDDSVYEARADAEVAHMLLTTTDKKDQEAYVETDEQGDMELLKEALTEEFATLRKIRETYGKVKTPRSLTMAILWSRIAPSDTSFGQATKLSCRSCFLSPASFWRYLPHQLRMKACILFLGLSFDSNEIVSPPKMLCTTLCCESFCRAL